jgi:hypothetical protein
MNKITGAVLVLAVFAWALVGCASISVEPGTAVATPQKPEKVYVEDFSTAKGEFNVDRDGADLVAFKKNLKVMMTTGITVDLTKRLIPAVAAEKNPFAKRENAWLIRGEFIRVNQGSRLLRGTVGFGLGATKLETRVALYDLATGSTTPFLTFATTGGSNAEPGGLSSIALDPVTLAIEAVSGAGNVAHGVTEDTARTAREITAELSDYMYRSHWISKDQWIVPKSYSN